MIKCKIWQFHDPVICGRHIHTVKSNRKTTIHEDLTTGMKQRAFKEQVFKLLFRAEFNTKEELLEQLPFYFEAGDMTVSEEDRAKIEKRLSDILDNLPEIDAKIASTLKNWKPERIGKVELTVIRMTAYELQTDRDTPVGVIINDAVEIAKKYGQEGAGQFVNGVLAGFVPDKES